MAEHEVEQALRRLADGRAPGRGVLLHTINCGTEDLIDFLSRHYLETYIPEGGSKIKFVTGRPGSGKTQLLELLADAAESRGFLIVELSAAEVWMHDFRELYLAILKRLDLQAILRSCAYEIIREMGYNPREIPAGQTFLDFLAERREADAISKSTIRSLLRNYFTKNPVLDNCFAGCCSLLTGDMLGYPALDNASRELLYSCLYGEKGVKASQLRALGITPARVTKQNARHLLRSLAEIIHRSGLSGLLVEIDDLERLMLSSTDLSIRYTKGKRDDAYENIRQLIDDIDSMRYLFFILGFDRDLIDNENSGMKSYQALWLRIQNEIVSTHFNCFADILDLDRLDDQVFNADLLCELSEKVSAVFLENGVAAAPLSEEQACEVLDAARYGSLGLPYLVIRRVLAGGVENV